MTGMSEYRVMTVNMWADFTHLFGTKVFSHRIHSIEALIDTYHPDVIGAQEVTSSMMKYMDRILREYGICGKQRKSLMNNEANPVLYRKDRFELLEEKTLWLSDTPEVEGSRYAMPQFPRIVTIVTLKNRLNGDTVTFANTHLDVNFASVRQKQAEKLCELLAKERSPICLTGDFNSHEKHDSIMTIRQAGYDDCASIQLGSTLRGNIGSRRFSHMPIDHIFFDCSFSRKEIHKLTETPQNIWPSDHYPLFAVLTTHA